MLDKTCTVPRQQKLKGTIRGEWVLHNNAVFEVFCFILGQNLLHLKFQWSTSASTLSCSCKEGDKAGWNRYGPLAT